MLYQSTRGSEKVILSGDAILKGIAEDGGLYVPSSIPPIGIEIDSLMNMNYSDLAFFIIGKYLTDFDSSILQECIDKSYDSKFDTPLIAPISHVGEENFLELYHGPTLAFKDMALTLLPNLMKAAAQKNNVEGEIVILTATSGDTGKAALEGFANVKGTRIIVFYPENGVSEIQKRQMITQEGENTLVVGIKGNFDDAQNGVKNIFNDSSFSEKLKKRNFMLSSANSINIGRLVPQIVYYFHAYLKMVNDGKIKSGEKMNFVVPTGNFGNILAAYYAKSMGLPVNKLICASNENKVLHDFLNTGTYDRRRDLKLTSSPSMDILISSNLERLLYEISGRNDSLIRELMSELQCKGAYTVPEYMREKLNLFYGGHANEDEVFESIKKVYASSEYLMDTHTAVAYSVYKKYKANTGDDTQTVIVSTASPFKFGKSVCKALDMETEGLDDFMIIKKLSEYTSVSIPESIKILIDKKIIHKSSCEKDMMKKNIEDFLKV